MALFASSALREYLKSAREEKDLLFKELYNEHIKGLRYFIAQHPSLDTKYKLNSFPSIAHDDLEFILDNSIEIERIDSSIRGYDQLCKWNEDFEEKADKSIDASNSDMGCYYYDVMYTNAEKIDICHPLEFTLWQHFAYGFYRKDNIKFTEKLSHIYERSNKLYKQPSLAAWDKFYNQLISLKLKFGEICVLWAKSKTDVDKLCIKNQFRYIRTKMAIDKIKGYFISDIGTIPENSNIIIVDYILSNDELKCFAKKIFSKISKKSQFITFLTFYKEYDLKEAIELNEEAKSSNGTNRRNINKTDKSLLSKIEYCTEKWEERIKDLPYTYIVDYVPYNSSRTDMEENALMNRKIILDFKNAYREKKSFDYEEALILVVSNIAKELIRTFGNLLNDITLVCVPSSNEDDYTYRCRDFSDLLCRLTGMDNSFEEIAYKENGSPKHLGGNYGPKIMYNRDFFEGRIAILFDDIITTGKTLLKTKTALEKVNAKVVGAITIGRTLNSI